MNWSKYPVEMQKKKMYFTTVEDMMTPYRPELKVDNKPLVDLPNIGHSLIAYNEHVNQTLQVTFYGTTMQAFKKWRLFQSAQTIEELVKLHEE